MTPESSPALLRRSPQEQAARHGRQHVDEDPGGLANVLQAPRGVSGGAGARGSSANNATRGRALQRAALLGHGGRRWVWPKPPFSARGCFFRATPDLRQYQGNKNSNCSRSGPGHSSRLPSASRRSNREREAATPNKSQLGGALAFGDGVWRTPAKPLAVGLQPAPAVGAQRSDGTRRDRRRGVRLRSCGRASMQRRGLLRVCPGG